MAVVESRKALSGIGDYLGWWNGVRGYLEGFRLYMF